MHAHTHPRLHTHTYTHACMHACTQKQKCLHTHIHKRTQIHRSLDVNTCAASVAAAIAVSIYTFSLGFFSILGCYSQQVRWNQLCRAANNMSSKEKTASTCMFLLASSYVQLQTSVARRN